ncbi:MAG: hypothetical protein AAFP82_07545 [Bacteroidota bacterium]
MATDYTAISSYAYVANSPLIFTDPDGRKVKPMNQEALQIIKLSLTPEEAQFIELTDDGFINQERLQEGMTKLSSTSENFGDLMILVGHEEIIEVNVSENLSALDGEGTLKNNAEIPLSFADPAVAADDWVLFGGNPDLSGEIPYMGKAMSYEEFKISDYDGDDYAPSGTTGVSLIPLGTPPNTEFDRKLTNILPLKDQKFSTNSNYQVVLNKRLFGKSKGLLRKLVITYSHEINGHILFKLQGKSMFHGQTRKCPEGNCENYNQELEERILEVSEEAGENFDKHEDKN